MAAGTQGGSGTSLRCLLALGAALACVPYALATRQHSGSHAALSDLKHSFTRGLRRLDAAQQPVSGSRAYRYVVVTPAGRRFEMALLHRALLKQKASFDEWYLWANTKTPEDRVYIEGLAAAHSWIKIKERLPHDNATQHGVHDPITNFFQHCQDPRTIYLRLDDDVVWLEPRFVHRMFHYHVMHPEPFIVYANIINNAVVTHIHQRLGNIPIQPLDGGMGMAGYYVMDELGWLNGTFAELIHRTFIRSVRDGHLYRWHFRRWILAAYEHVSVNAHTFRGADFAAFKGFLTGWEERALAIHKPKELGRPNIIYGGAICVHFAFGPQRGHLKSIADQLLSQYAELDVVEQPAA